MAKWYRNRRKLAEYFSNSRNTTNAKKVLDFLKGIFAIRGRRDYNQPVNRPFTLCGILRHFRFLATSPEVGSYNLARNVENTNIFSLWHGPIWKMYSSYRYWSWSNFTLRSCLFLQFASSKHATTSLTLSITPTWFLCFHLIDSKITGSEELFKCISIIAQSIDYFLCYLVDNLFYSGVKKLTVVDLQKMLTLMSVLTVSIF